MKNKLILMSNSPPTQSQENKQGKNLRGNFTVEEIVSSDQLLIKKIKTTQNILNA